MATSSAQRAEVSSFEREVRSILDKAESARQGTRREAGVLHPLGRKAARTRAALLEAAFELFVDAGYRATSVQDIHERAGVSLGTFYQYFREKADVIAALVGELIVQASEHLFQPGDLRPGHAGATAAVGPYVKHYASTSDFQRVWEEVTHIEPDVASIRWQLTSLIDAGLSAAIARGQRAGTVNPALDAAATAQALNAMVDRQCYLTFVVEGRRDRAAVTAVLDALATIWERVLHAA